MVKPENDDLLIHVSRRAMASEFEVCFPAGICENGTDLALEALDRVEWLEDRLSFFRPGSQISRINCLAAETPVEVEPWLFNLLHFAVRLFEETGGAYDITSTPLWEAWGFARRDGRIPSDVELAEARSCVGGHLVELDADRRTIHFRKPGVKINLGSIGKGHALDVCSERLLELGMTDFLLHGGKSSVLGHGGHKVEVGRGRGEESPLWEIGIPDPHQPGHRLGMIRLRNRALGTSGGQFQSFRHQGRRYGHILDPRSGQPAEGVISTTVTAPTAAAADALSTAFHVMGPQPSLAYCQTHPEIGLVMLCPRREGKKVEMHVAGLGEGDFTM